ncbi:MAG: penicillin-binding protein 2 [Hyphomicrobiales bacterium]|nr:penicillin-binding protein 2 [Hyphomicrobiales bacterium]
MFDAPPADPQDSLPPPQKPRASRLIERMFSTKLKHSDRRIALVGVAFTGVFLLIGGRLVELGFKGGLPIGVKSEAAQTVSAERPDILDRHGKVLATDVKTVSVFAEPRNIIDKDAAVEELTAILPDVDPTKLRKRLGQRRGFVWVKRTITPKQREQIFQLGLPGIGFLPDFKRYYPNGPLAAHVIGFTNEDNLGIAGMEKYIDGQGLMALHGAGFVVHHNDLKPVKLSIDLDVTQVVRDELLKGIEKFKAKSAAAAIMDVRTGEVIALESLPDFDPNEPSGALSPDKLNRMTAGVYEMGSTFKSISIAMAIQENKVNLRSTVDARHSLHFGKFTIHDYHATHRMLTVPEVFVHSSNIGTAQMVMKVGVDGHQAFLKEMGQLTRMRTELPESAAPLVPHPWSLLNTVTIAFGQGLNVAPLQAMMAVSALVNGGNMMTPTFLMRSEKDALAGSKRVVRPDVSEAIDYLMRINAEIGSARKANVPGYFIGGKTGTADKIIHGRYDHNKVFTTFTAVAPANDPKYLFMAIMDEPQGLPSTFGYHTAAWNVGEITAKIINRAGPMLGLEPQIDLPKEPFPLLAKLGFGFANIPQTGGPVD